MSRQGMKHKYVVIHLLAAVLAAWPDEQVRRHCSECHVILDCWMTASITVGLGRGGHLADPQLTC